MEKSDVRQSLKEAIQPLSSVLTTENQEVTKSSKGELNKNTDFPESELPKAGFVVRWAASVLDGLILAIPILIISIPFYKSGKEVRDAISGLIFVTYSVVAIANYQTTIGKNFFYLKVVSKEGGNIGYAKAIIREFFGKIISSFVFSLGYLWVIWDREKQAWHDKIAGTYVVQKQEMGREKKILAYVLAFILPTIAILGILATIILVAINPSRQISKARKQQEKIEQEQIRRKIQIQELYDLQIN